jgi:NTP pyrophosphatase (non-canonical NTP hydrolase)
MADSLAELQVVLDAFVEERNWAQFHTPKNLAMGVAIEAAEIMEHFQWCTPDESYSLPKEKRAEVANEIGDVLMYLLGLGRTLDIDIIAAARDKLALNREKYPIAKAKGRAAKYVDLD